MKNSKPTIVVDIDGVLCTDKGDYARRIPSRELIEKVRKLSSIYRIVLWTSRPISARTVTLTWLRKNEVVFDKLILSKPRANFYVDDRFLSPEKFLNYIHKEEIKDG